MFDLTNTIYTSIILGLGATLYNIIDKNIPNNIMYYVDLYVPFI